MMALPGTRLPRSPLASARWVADLIELDGPLLSEFRNQANEPILFSWCDHDDEKNRWLAFRVRERDLIRLVMRRADLHSLVSAPADGLLYVVEIDEQGHHQACSLTEPAGLPQEYMPDPESFLPGTRSGSGRSSYAVLIDGDWDSEEISGFTSKFQQTYLALHVYGRKREARQAAHNYPWKGGFSAVHFYNGLRGQVSAEARPQLDAFVYSSPGFAKWRLDWTTADAVRFAVERFGKNRARITSTAKRAYDTIRAWGLNERHAQPLEPESEQDKYLGSLFYALAEALGSVDAELVKATHGDNFICLKIVLSIHTRLEFLHDLAARGMAEY